MAYGGRKDIGWVQCWNNGKYAVDVYVYYYQDIWANKTKLVADNQRVRSLDSYHGFYNANVNNGFGWQTHGGGAVDVNDSVNVPKGGTWTRGNSRSCSVERAHDSNGTCPTTNLSCQFIAGIYQYDTPEFDWRSTNVAGSVQKIDRSAPSLTTSVNSKGMNHVTFNLKSDSACDLVQYSIDNGGSWENAGISLTANLNHTFTINGLGTYTAYNCKFRARRAHNGVFSGQTYVWVQTNKPSAPSMGTIYVKNSTPTSITAHFNEYGSFGSGASWGYYQWKLSTESNWRNVNNSNAYKFTGLSPNKQYTIQCRLVDNYGSVSSTASISHTTPKPPAPSTGRVSVSEITPFTAKITWSGFNADSLASIVQYSWSLDGKNWNYVNVSDAGSSILISGLKEETEYTLYFCAKDNYGTWSGNATTKFTTLVDQLKLKVNVGGVTKVGKVFVNVGGTPKKVKKAFVNVNGQARIILKG